MRLPVIKASAASAHGRELKNMKRHQTRVVRLAFLSLLVVVLCGGASGGAANVEPPVGVAGQPGRPDASAVVRFLDLVEGHSAGGQRKTRPDKPIKAGVPVAGAEGGEAVGEPLLTAASSLPSPPPSASFAGLQDNATTFNPDTQGAVGTNHMVVMLSSQVRIQNRSGGTISTVSLDTFWGVLGQSNVFDPRIIYDPLRHRWLTTAINHPGTSNAHLLFGVSQTADPTALWYLHALQVDTNDGVFASSPSIGFNRDWVVISANMMNQTGLYYDYTDIFAFNRTNVYAGGVAAYHRWSHYPVVPALADQEPAVPVPAVHYDDNSATNFLVANAGTFGDGLGRLRVLSISGPVAAPFFNDYGQALYIAAGANFGFPGWVSEAPGDGRLAPQLGTTNRIFIGDARIQNVAYRNGALWATHHVFLPTNNPTRVAVQWWSFSPGGTVLQFGRMDDATGAKMYAYPSIGVNRYEDVLIGYSRFAATQYPSANYAFHSYQDGLGQLSGDTVLKLGEARFTVADGELILWGDWSATMPDPRNDTDLWTIQEYASTPVNSIERWGTWWGRVSPPTSLGVSVVAAPSQLIAGSNIVYTTYITNFSSHLATGIRFTNTLPAGAVFISAVASQGECLQTNGVVRCDLGDVPGDVFSNVVATVTVVARINEGGLATNSVSVGGYSQDENSLDNAASVVTAVNTASDIAITLVPSSTVVIISNTVTFALTTTNRGPSSATSVFVTNVLSAGMTFVSASSSNGSCTNLAGRVTCVLGTLATGAGATASIVARAAVSGAMTAQSTATSAALDPDLVNNNASVVVRGNNLPALQAISNRTITEDSVLGPIAFTVSDVETPADGLVLGAFSSNPSIVPSQNIVFEGSGNSRSVTITPAFNASGAITITRTLTDSDGSVVSNSFVLTIDPLNDAPVVSDIADQSVNEDTVIGPLAFAIGDAETAAGSLTISAASSNPALIPNANIVFGGSGSNRTVRVTPATNQSGTATITITVRDGVLAGMDSFVVTVNSVNDLPTISDSPNRVINEDTSTTTVFFSVNDVETAVTNLTVVGVSSNQTIVPNGNIVITGVGTSRSLVVTPATNQFGSVAITLSVTDGNGGVSSDSFVLTINPVNDAPTLNSLTNISILEDSGTQSVLLTGIGTGATNEGDTLTLTVTSGTPSLIPSPGVVPYTQGNSSNLFSFTPVANSNGSSVMTVQLNDGRPSNNIVVRTFTVTVQAVNDVPTIAGLGARTINEDGNTGPLPFVVGDVESTASFLTVSGASSDTNLVPDANIVFGGSASNRTVTVTPSPDQFGTAQITVFVRDGSATNASTFSLTVLPVNDLPGISPVTNRTINEDVSTNVSLTVFDKETPAAALTLVAVSSNPALFPGITFGGSSSNRTVNLLPATNQSGSATITLSVLDSDGGSNGTTFVVSVVPVDDPPTVNGIAGMVLDEDAVVAPVVLSGIGAGAPNENQTITVTAVTTNSHLLTNLVVSYTSPSASGNLTFGLVPDAHGTGYVTVLISDGVSIVSRTFDVVVNSVNDAPVVNPLGDVEVDEDTLVPVPLFVSDDDTPADDLVVTVLSSNPEVLDETGITVTGAGTNRVIQLMPLEEASGNSTITVTVQDGAGGETSVAFELTVRFINDAPDVSTVANQVMAEDGPTLSIPFVVQDAEVLPSGLLVSARSSNQSLLPDANIVLGGGDGSRTISLTPVPDGYGIATVSIEVREGNQPGDLAVTNTFLLTVEPRNDAPTLDAISSLVIPADAGLQTVSLSGISMGAANDNQALVITSLSSLPAVIPDPAVVYTSPGVSGSLAFTPAAGATGLVQITVFVSETGGASEGATNRIARSFTVNVSGPGPALLVEQVNGEAVISWSTNSLLNWRLESSTNLAPPVVWVVEPAIPVAVGDRFTVTNSVGTVTRFYRLRNQ